MTNLLVYAIFEPWFNSPMDNFDNRSKELKFKIPCDETLIELAETFKLLSDPTRLKIICLLFQKELSVYDLAKLLGVSESVVSHQIKNLRMMKLVKFRRQGKRIFYRFNTNNRIRCLFDEGLKQIQQNLKE